MLAWAIFLTLMMLVCIALEIFTSSMGPFALAAGICGIASGYMAFQDGDTTGYLLSALNILLYPTALFFMVGKLRQSRLNNTVEIRPSTPSEKPEPPPLPSPEWESLLGQTGNSITMLRPSGVAQFGERRLDVMSDGAFIEAGKPVKALRVDGGKVLVVQEVMSDSNYGI